MFEDQNLTNDCWLKKFIKSLAIYLPWVFTDLSLSAGFERTDRINKINKYHSRIASSFSSRYQASTLHALGVPKLQQNSLSN